MVRKIKIRNCCRCGVEFEGTSSYCKIHRNEASRNSKRKHQERIKISNKSYRTKNKNKNKIEYNRKIRKINDPEYSKRSYQRNKENILISNKKWVDSNPEWFYKTTRHINSTSKLKSNPLNYDEYKKRKAKIKRERSKEDPAFRLRNYASHSIYSMLKKRGHIKAKKSILKYLPYSFHELRIYIESLFEYWMTWENQGVYDLKTWDNNDPSTWKWQLDHIIPHSIFYYENMECEEFRACWSLSNLRPLSAKQNYLDGINRTRHKKINK